MSKPKRVLLVDDDHDHLLVCTVILRRNGFVAKGLLGCEQMEELIKTVDTFRPDVIYMDHDMPGICGMDMVKMLKSHPEYKKIPVIYFTGRDDAENLAKLAGADDYFAKPFQSEKLVEITGKYTSG